MVLNRLKCYMCMTNRGAEISMCFTIVTLKLLFWGVWFGVFLCVCVCHFRSLAETPGVAIWENHWSREASPTSIPLGEDIRFHILCYWNGFEVSFPAPALGVL